ncbi:MAG: hypothetical protein AMXMBFR53_25500 [Gemmatimonadota bacterium]
MTRSLSFHAALPLVLLLAAPTAAAAQIDSLHVPMDLVMALLGGRGEGTRIMVGALPPEVQEAIPLGDVRRVVGSLSSPSGGTMVVEVTGSARQALDDYKAYLEAQGWRRPVPAADERGGFQTTEVFPGQSTLCGEGYFVHPSSMSFDERTYLRVNFGRRERWNVCDPPDTQAMRPADLFGGLRFPSLEPPPRTTVQRGSGGGSSRSVDAEATLGSSLPLDVLFEHYARQLTAAGWVPEGRATGEGVAIGRWRVRDEGEPDVVGTLTLWALMAEDAYRAVLRMERPEERTFFPPGT